MISTIMNNRHYPSVISIVITYNGEKWVDACFSSLTNAKLSNHTILAVDNGSTDRTIQILEDKFPSVKIIKNKSNLGFGKANNIGFSFGV